MRLEAGVDYTRPENALARGTSRQHSRTGNGDGATRAAAPHQGAVVAGVVGAGDSALSTTFSSMFTRNFRTLV